MKPRKGKAWGAKRCLALSAPAAWSSSKRLDTFWWLLVPITLYNVSIWCYSIATICNKYNRCSMMYRSDWLYEYRTKLGITKVVLRWPWSRHHCTTQMGGPPYLRMSICHIPNFVYSSYVLICYLLDLQPVPWGTGVASSPRQLGFHASIGKIPQICRILSIGISLEQNSYNTNKQLSFFSFKFSFWMFWYLEYLTLSYNL